MTYIYIQFKVTKMKHTWFPVTLSFVLMHSPDSFNLSDKCQVSLICLTSG